MHPTTALFRAATCCCVALSLLAVVPACRSRDGSGPGTRLLRSPRALFDQLPPPVVSENAPARLVLRPGPAAPPANRTELPFPPPRAASGPAPESAREPLRVLGYSPRGTDSLVGAVRVTFSQPMVPLEALSALRAERVPLEIAPAPPGRFRWLGAETVVFEPEGTRMPMATTYTVRVPAGARAQSGATLAEPVEFSFRTPELELVEAHPADMDTTVARRPVIALRFNQRVDPPAIAAAVRLVGGPGAAPLALLASSAELARVRDAVPGVRGWEDGYWVALEPRADLAGATRYTLSVPQGTRSAEGPNPTRRAVSVRFVTHGEFRAVAARCGYDNATPCAPGDAPRVELTNPVAPSNDLAALISVTPEVPRLMRLVGWNGVHLTGDFSAQTTYTITLRAALRDTFGQTLGRDTTLPLRVADARPEASVNVDAIATLERGSARAVPVDLINVRGVQLRAAAVPFDKLLRAVDIASGYYFEHNGGPFETLGLAPRSAAVNTRAPRNQRDRLGVDVSPEVAPGAAGFALLDVGIPLRDYVEHNLRLVQVTDLGLTAAIDTRGGVARVVSLATGAPVAGARVELYLPPDDGSAPTLEPVATATTDAAGIARLSARTPIAGRVVTVATHGDDRAVLLTRNALTPDELAAAVFTDRNPYRPGDTVRARIIARLRRGDARGTIAPLPEGTALECSLVDPHDEPRDRFTVTLDAYGAASREVATQPDAATGTWRLRCGTSQFAPVEGAFDLEEYRAPEVSVTVTPAEGARFHRDATRLTVASEYLFGAPAAGLRVHWSLRRAPAAFAPPGHGEFTFGDASASGDPLGFGGPYRVRTERRWGREREVSSWNGGGGGEEVASGDATLDPRGRLEVPATLDPGRATGPLNFVLEARVTDTSGQAVAGRATVVAHPADRYTGLRLDRPFVREGEPLVARAIVTDLAGAAQPGVAVTVRALEHHVRAQPRQVDGQWTYEYVTEDREVGRCALTSAARDAVDCRIAPQRAGAYTLEATARDAQNRAQTTRTQVFVHGGMYAPSENTGVVEVVPDKREYAAGDTAHLLVRAPFARGRGLLVVERRGIVDARPVDFDGNVQLVDVPVTAADVPGLQVRLALARGRATDAELAALVRDAGPDARAAMADDVGRPQWATGAVALEVNDAPKRLTVDVRPDHPEMGPGGRLGIDLTVRDARGQPADAELTVMLVDEAVLSLLAYPTPDPVASLHQTPQGTAASESVLAHLIRRRAMRGVAQGLRAIAVVGESVLTSQHAAGNLTGDTIGDAFGYGGLGAVGTGWGGGGTGEATIGLGNIGTMGHGAAAPTAARERASGSPVPGARVVNAIAALGEAPASARTLFATTAFYRDAVRTDARGRAHLDVTLPDNLTTFRIMAVAAGRDDRGGKGEATVRVRKTVVLRPALPRFATWGDTFQAGVVVHNETREASDVVVGIRAAGLAVAGEGIERVRLAAGESRLVRFPVTVDAARGRARVQFAASAHLGSDAAELDLPLVEPATSEAVATYGSLTGGAVRVPVTVPADVVPRFGGLELSLSSTALTGLDDAARWLISHDHACTEPLASELIAAAALRQILGGGRTPDGDARAQAAADGAIRQLRTLQRGDGGFGYWSEDRRSALYVSAWATFALGEAARAGLTVPPEMLRRAREFVGRRLRSPDEQAGEHLAWSEQAFALYTQAEAGRIPDADVLARVHRRASELPLFAQAWLARALGYASRTDPRAAELWRQIGNAAVLTAAGAHFAEARVESARLLWHSERRTDAIVLAALLERDATDPLIERTARALAATRARGGHWATTNETAWALTALVRYYRVAEATTPALTASAWLGTQTIGETEFRGRSSRVVDGRVPMAELLAMGPRPGDVVVASRGEGRLYYRLGLRLAPRDLRLPPASEGFTVSRVYEPVGEASTVRRDADGTWHVRAGADVRVRLTLVVPDDRYDVALDDPLPAGLEATNLRFATTAGAQLGGALQDTRVDARSYWAPFAFDHRELRDDRVVAYARRAPAGVYELTYLARATTPGRFVATATRVEEMYAPETFGRAVTEYLVVDP